MATEPQVCRKSWASSIWGGALPPALSPECRLPQAQFLGTLWEMPAQPSGSSVQAPTHRAYVGLVWSQLGLIYSDTIKAGSFQDLSLQHRALHSGSEKGDLLWQLDFSFGEDSCSPKYLTPLPGCAA